MKDSGLLLIMDKKGDSLLCASLYEYLEDEERKRAFYLVEEREIHKIIEEEQKKGRWQLLYIHLVKYKQLNRRLRNDISRS